MPLSAASTHSFSVNLISCWPRYRRRAACSPELTTPSPAAHPASHNARQPWGQSGRRPSLAECGVQLIAAHNNDRRLLHFAGMLGDLLASEEA